MQNVVLVCSFKLNLQLHKFRNSFSHFTHSYSITAAIWTTVNLVSQCLWTVHISAINAVNGHTSTQIVYSCRTLHLQHNQHYHQQLIEFVSICWCWTSPRLPLVTDHVWGTDGQDVEVRRVSGLGTSALRLCLLQMMWFGWLHQTVISSTHWSSLWIGSELLPQAKEVAVSRDLVHE